MTKHTFVCFFHSRKFVICASPVRMHNCVCVCMCALCIARVSTQKWTRVKSTSFPLRAQFNVCTAVPQCWKTVVLPPLPSPFLRAKVLMRIALNYNISLLSRKRMNNGAKKKNTFKVNKFMLCCFFSILRFARWLTS